MPITYDLDPVGIIRTRCVGNVLVVVSQTVIFGTARAVETFAEHHFTASRVFWSMPEAESWLETTRSSGKK